MAPEGLIRFARPLPEAVYLVAEDGAIAAANPAASRMLGLRQAALCGQSLTALVTDPREKVARYLENCSRSGQMVKGSLNWRTADQGTVPCHAEGAAVLPDPGRSEGYVLLRCKPKSGGGNRFAALNQELEALKAAHRQLEERKDLLEQRVRERTAALTASETRCRAIVEAAGDGIITFDSAGIVESLNTAAEKIFGQAAQEIIGRDIALLMPGVDLDACRQYTTARSSRGASIAGTGSREMAGRRRDGSAFAMELTASRVNLPSQELFIGVVRDVTERKRTEQQLADSAAHLQRYAVDLWRTNQELDQFAYVASHDLKAPLRAIANLSKWIEEDLGDGLDAGIRKQMDLLRGRVHRMEALIEGILQYSRIGRVNVDTEPVDTGALLGEVLDSLTPPPGFTIRIDPDMPTLEASRIELQQVFANLIGNAVKYHHRPDGNVRVSAGDAGDFWEFVVADDGPGIAPEYHEKIFAIFQTLEARDKVESTGIGLTIVKKIIEGRGGAITVESQPGEGAAFRFTWPKQRRAG